MKKMITIVTCLSMALCLWGCGQGESEPAMATTAPVEASQPEPSAEPTAAPTEAPAPEVDLEAEKAALLAVLEEIDSDSRPGTAGCSLTAIRIAADTLNWGCATALSPEQIGEATAQWLEDKGYGSQSDFNSKMDLVYNAYQSLIAQGSGELMSEAGVDYDEGTWGFEPVPAVEALESAIGPSDAVY